MTIWLQRITKRIIKLLPVLALAMTLGAAAPAAQADAPSLQVAPFQYNGSLTPGHVSSGFVDVSNPTDSPAQISSSVRGFRQTGTTGDLQFFDDPDLTAGIKVDLSSFTLGPREAVRVVFSVDPSKLPQGGIYAAIFFRTNPVNQSNTGTSFVAQSANVGTLLILTNGGPGSHRGNITGLSVPFWQFGRGLHGGVLTFKNTDTSKVAVAFKPALSTTVLPSGRSTKFSTGLVLPGVTRQFNFDRPGTYFGLLPITVSDSDTGHHATVWVFACTGASPWLLLLFLLLAIGITVVYHHYKPRLSMPNLNLPSRRVPKVIPAVTPVPEPELVPKPETPTDTEPKVEPNPEPALETEVAELLTQAEASSPDPGTVVMPTPIHKVGIKIEAPVKSSAKPKPAPKPKPKSAKVHKLKVQSKDKSAKKSKPRS